MTGFVVQGHISRYTAQPYLVPGVLAHVQATHPHVGEQHLCAGVSHERPEARRHGQLQTGGVAPVLQLVRQQLHGHRLVLPKRLLQQIHRQRAELTEHRHKHGFRLALILNTRQKNHFQHLWFSSIIVGLFNALFLLFYKSLWISVC